jgi:hypothetical protein
MAGARTGRRSNLVGSAIAGPALNLSVPAPAVTASWSEPKPDAAVQCSDDRVIAELGEAR